MENHLLVAGINNDHYHVKYLSHLNSLANYSEILILESPPWSQFLMHDPGMNSITYAIVLLNACMGRWVWLGSWDVQCHVYSMWCGHTQCSLHVHHVYKHTLITHCTHLLVYYLCLYHSSKYTLPIYVRIRLIILLLGKITTDGTCISTVYFKLLMSIHKQCK